VGNGEKMTKKKALAEHLEIKSSEIEQSSYNENIFEIGNQEYLVLTDDEADQRTKEYIADSVWAFNSDFIIEHSSALDYDEASKKVIMAIAEQYESGNEAMKKLIDNFDEFAEDAISADGRGHFLSSYDGEEWKNGDYYIYRIN
jgi:hypothetical protein